MEIAVISDIHGNWTALMAVMEEIRRLGISQVVCLGDRIDPLPSSKRVCQYLFDRNIPMIRGNHEDYVIRASRDADDELCRSVRFKPVHLVAKDLDQRTIERLERLPLHLTISDWTGDGGILFCHASPHSNFEGWKHGISQALATDLKTFPQKTIVCGHWHDPKTETWEDKTLVTVGSVGVPLAGKLEVEFLVLRPLDVGGWQAHHLTIPYNVEKTISEYQRSGWIKKGGPIAWLILFELITAQRKMAPYFAWLGDRSRSINAEKDWEKSVRDYFSETGGWEILQPFLK